MKFGTKTGQFYDNGEPIRVGDIVEGKIAGAQVYCLVHYGTYVDLDDNEKEGFILVDAYPLPYDPFPLKGDVKGLSRIGNTKENPELFCTGYYSS